MKTKRPRGRPPQSACLPSTLVARYVSGELGARQVATEAGLTYHLAKRELRRLGVLRTSSQGMWIVRGRKLAPLYARVQSLRDDGLSFAEIGRQVGRSRERVRQIADGAKSMSSQKNAASTFGARLRVLRLAAQFTQLEVAERAGLTKNTVARLERGEYTPSWETAQRLARALGVGVGEFEEAGK